MSNNSSQNATETKFAMGQCFHPDCNHTSESHCCRFFSFPDQKKHKTLYDKWISFVRRGDRKPSKHSRLCSCHFKDGRKENMPTISDRNRHKLFDSLGLLPGTGPTPPSTPTPKKKRKVSAEPTKLPTVASVLEEIKENSEPCSTECSQEEKTSSKEALLSIELDMTSTELAKHKEVSSYYSAHYSAKSLSPEVIRMETGLPTKDVFDIVVGYVSRFKGEINYYAGWKVEAITLEDQIFITLMKLTQNYTNLHLAQLFSCSVATVANIVLTFVHVLHSLLFKDIMTTVPSREKNKMCLPSSFTEYSSCRIVIDCTDIEIAAPKLKSQQNATYSSYRGMNSFKVIIGVAPNGVITYVSDLFPGSVSDKVMVKESGFCKHLSAGDLVLADKGFLISDVVPRGVSVNIPPFLNNGKFTESEARATKSIARCRIHVERANARLKSFRILGFIPAFLRCHADKLCQLCSALVNLQYPLIKDGCEDFEFD